MFLPCATVRRVMPGQISIVGLSCFMMKRLRGTISRANNCFPALYLLLANYQRPLAESGHENTHLINHNPICDDDCSSLICAKPGGIPCYRHGFGGNFKRPAKSAGDDETNDGDGEVE